MTTKRHKRHGPEEIVWKLLDANAILGAEKDPTAMLQSCKTLGGCDGDNPTDQATGLRTIADSARLGAGHTRTIRGSGNDGRRLRSRNHRLINALLTRS